MASYSLRIVKSVKRDLRRLDRAEIKRIDLAFEAISENPFPPGNFKKIKGSERSFRVRVCDYRVLYEVDSENREVTIFKVRHRRDVYR